MPTWANKGRDRGLLGWGQTRKNSEKGEPPREKKGAIPEICRAPLMSAINQYFHLLGAPPVVAGESLRKAIKRGRFTEDYSPKRSRNTRGQPVLVPLEEEREVNIKRPFLMFLTAVYCLELCPPVDDGTEAQSAVLGFLGERLVFSHIASVYTGKLQRLGNNHLLSSVCKALNAWVREGEGDKSKTERLKSVRDLTDPDGSGELPFLLVSALVDMSRGRKTVLPFGKPASESTKAFKNIPSPVLGLALAQMYVFIKLDPDLWKGLLSKKNKKGCCHPMTHIWHVNDVNRFVNFISVFRANRKALFEAYEKEGGDYHGKDSSVSSSSKKTSKSNKVKTVIENGSDSDDMSDDFM